MALFSDVDWVIIAVAAAFLLFGKESSQTMRMLGRWYGRLLRFKADLLTEVTSGEVALPTASPASIRGALFGATPPTELPVGARSHRFLPGVLTEVQPVTFWSVEVRTLGAGMGAEAWWITTTNAPGEVVRLR